MYDNNIFYDTVRGILYNNNVILCSRVTVYYLPYTYMQNAGNNK